MEALRGRGPYGPGAPTSLEAPTGLEALPGHLVSQLITNLKVLLIREVALHLRACQRLEVASVPTKGRQD